MADGFLGTAFTVAGAVAKLSQLGFELAGVEDDLLVFRDTLQHDYERLEFVRTERSRKLHLLDSRTLNEIDSVLHSCQRACGAITVLVDEPLTRIKKKGRVNFGQRVEWVFRDSSLAKALNDYRQTTHISLMGVWSLLLHLQIQHSAHSLPSPYSQNASALQYDEYDQDSVQSASKPRSWSRPMGKLTAPQVGGIRVEESSPRWRASFEENGFAGLGYAVVDVRQSAKPPTTKAYESKDHLWDSDSEVGSILARREIALSRRHWSGPDLKTDLKKL